MNGKPTEMSFLNELFLLMTVILQFCRVCRQ